MAAIPSSGLLMATHDYYRCLGSTASNSSCGGAEYPGEAIPHHPGPSKAGPGHWMASFFFGKSTLPFMATRSESPQASSNLIACDLTLEAMRKQQPGGQSGKANTEHPSPVPRGHWPSSGGARLIRAPPVPSSLHVD
ncbi:pancreatic progenitor cell differentiation and proliferation factor-like [Felis catus]|uniref:pancreatic progenitor cell differentiation and proliferation factor-like n=1 Tax=Felis catus TaxID=9685 RepID=UPI001D1A0107|nr:pancreatic progenitor cell differentiation and proliferation factor-like [Felis catus]